MFLDQTNKFQTYTSKLTIQKPTFLHIIPDFNIDVVDSLLHLNLGLSNCQFIYVKTTNIKFGNKQINPKMYYYKLKEREDIPATLIQSLPTKLANNKFVVVDHSILSQGIQQLIESNSNVKLVIQILFDKLKEEFLTLKSKYPNAENVILFNLSIPEDGLINVLDAIKLFSNEPNLFKCFDNWCIVAVSAGPQHTTYIPLMGYDGKGNVEVLSNNLSKVHSALMASDPVPLPEIEPAPEKSAEQDIIKTALVDKISDTMVQSSEKLQDKQAYNAIIELDKVKLAKVLKGFQIKDPVVANNIKSAIDQYLKTNSKANRTDLESLILKSIHFSLFNDDKVPDEYIADPSKLISKLSEMNTQVKDITYPESTHNPQIVSPGDIISIHKITGVGRHKYEFGPNLDFAVRNLFQTLENRKINPIKVLKIKSELQDNNLDRVREYTITVKNQSAGIKDPYDLKLRVPALVNDYYFKLNGQNYVMNNQLYLKPLTKDKDGEMRFLSHYNMCTLRVVNSKFNTSQINDVLNYIRIKYPTGTKAIEVDPTSGNVTKIEFLDGSIVEPGSQTPFISKDKEIVFDEGEYKLHDKVNDMVIDLHMPKNEYIFHELLLQIQKVNPDEQLNRTAKTIPYIQAHMMGKQLPLIFFLWQQIGLIETLVRHNINYEVGEKTNPNNKAIIDIALTGGKHLFIYPTNKRQELIVNGLLQLPKGFSLGEKDLSSRNALDDFINSKYGNRATFNFDLMMDNIIDPTTKDLLEFEEQPTNFIDLLNGPMLNKLLNDSPDHPADLKNLRLRQSEVLTNLLYSELCMSLNKYNNDLANGVTDAKLYFHPDYIIMNLLGRHAHSSNDESSGGVMDFNTTFSPVDELVKVGKLIKTGPGGVPSKRAFRKEHRAIHESYIGTVASHSISEYSSVGITNTLTLGASISNNYGGFGGKRANYTPDNIDSMSIDEYMIPFAGHMDSERLVLARTHISQKMPILNGELPIIL